MNNSFVIPMTRARFEQARAKLAAQGIVLTRDIGLVEGHKVGVMFDFDEADGSLTLTVEHKPHLYPESAVEKEIRKWFEEI